MGPHQQNTDDQLILHDINSARATGTKYSVPHMKKFGRASCVKQFITRTICFLLSADTSHILLIDIVMLLRPLLRMTGTKPPLTPNTTPPLLLT